MRIVHLCDLHLEPAPERRFPGLAARLEHDLYQLRATGADLFLVTGDLTTYGTSQPEHLTLARQWLDRLGAPWIAVPGNHDLGASPQRGARYPEEEAWEDVPYAETAYGRMIDSAPVRSLDLGPLRVVAFGIRETDPDDTIAELDRTLSQSPDQPVLLAGHYPVVDIRLPAIHDSFGSADFLPETMRGLQLLIDRHPQVRLYACGHIHLTTAARLTGHCVQLTAGGLGPGASTYRIYDIDGERLTYSTALGSGPTRFWEPLLGVADRGAAYSLGTVLERSGVLELSADANFARDSASSARETSHGAAGATGITGRVDTDPLD